MYSTGRLSPRTRAHLVSEAERIGVSRAARHIGVSRRTAYRWRRRADAFSDRSSKPHHSPRQTSEAQAAAILGLRMELRWGPDRLGPYLGVPASTAYAVLRRFGAARLRQLFPVQRPVRGTFTVTAPGYIAIDIKSLGSLERGGGRRGPEHHPHNHGRDVGWQHLFVAIDMASRLVYAQLRPGKGTADALGFLEAAVAFFDGRGIRVERILTDNGFQTTFTKACAALGDPPPPDQALPPLDQWPGRGFHRHHPARVHLRRPIHRRRPARACDRAVHRLLQRRAPPHRDRWPQPRALVTSSRCDPGL